MTFGAETDHFARQFNSGWGLRAETPLSIARRVRMLCVRLADVQPEYRDIWPLFAFRAIRPGVDPGPILDLSEDDLATLIDRKSRYDPPQRPAPVGSQGYDLVISTNRPRDRDPLALGVGVSAGVYGAGANRNGVTVEPHVQSPVWQDRAVAQRVLDGLVEAFEPDWACANAFINQGDDDQGHRRPWLAWSAKGCETPSYWVEHGGASSEQRNSLGGELRIWL